MDNLTSKFVGGSANFAVGGLVQGTGAGSVKTVNTITYAIDGILKTKGATDNLATAGNVVPVSSSSTFFFYVDIAGTITCVQGNTILTANLGVSQVLSPPGLQNGKALFGAVRVATDATHPFTPGTTALNAAGITPTYYDLMGAPSAPWTA